MRVCKLAQYESASGFNTRFDNMRLALLRDRLRIKLPLSILPVLGAVNFKPRLPHSARLLLHVHAHRTHLRGQLIARHATCLCNLVEH